MTSKRTGNGKGNGKQQVLRFAQNGRKKGHSRVAFASLRMTSKRTGNGKGKGKQQVLRFAQNGRKGGPQQVAFGNGRKRARATAGNARLDGRLRAMYDPSCSELGLPCEFRGLSKR